MPVFNGLRTPDRRIMVVTGHYGSGKTEFCVSLAMRLARTGYGRAASALTRSPARAVVPYSPSFAALAVRPGPYTPGQRIIDTSLGYGALIATDMWLPGGE